MLPKLELDCTVHCLSVSVPMARSRGEAEDTRVKIPQQSFLHTKFKKPEEAVTVIPINVEKEERGRGQVVRAERVNVKEEEQRMTSSWTAERRSESAKSNFSSAKSVFTSDNDNASVKSSLPLIKIGNSNNGKKCFEKFEAKL